MQFTKMEGCGNDYIYVNGFVERIENPAALSVRLSAAHTGIGADGLILILPSDKADCFMDIYNADGSRAKMCGNGLRCAGKLLYDLGLTHKKELVIDTLSGLRSLTLIVEGGKITGARAAMGKPDFFSPPFMLLGRRVAPVSMGNPHGVVFLKPGEQEEPAAFAKALSKCPQYPEGVNLELAWPTAEGYTVQVFERGSGETLACGTGASAVFAAALREGLIESPCRIRLKGGVLELSRGEEGEIFLTGPAVTVFTGRIEL